MIFDSMHDNECLMLAHHANDQSETFLYRLFRGSSPKGLSCMKKASQRGGKLILRPFLDFYKNDIEQLSKSLNIDYVEDVTNSDLSLDRNYIRRKIIPHIAYRWESFDKVMSHNIKLQADYHMTANYFLRISIIVSLLKNI